MPSEPATPQFQIYTATHTCLSVTLHLQLVEFRDSVFVWVGAGGKEVLGNFATAIPSLHGGPPAATTLLSNDVQETSKQLAQRLARKFNKRFFASINLPDDQNLVPLTEKKIFEFVKEHLS